MDKKARNKGLSIYSDNPFFMKFYEKQRKLKKNSVILKFDAKYIYVDIFKKCLKHMKRSLKMKKIVVSRHGR